MSHPIVEITFKGLMHSEPLYDTVKTKAESLSKHFDGILTCHVVLEQIQRHKQHGKLNHVRIHLTMPEKKDIAITHNAHEDIYLAVRDAFQDAIRQLRDHNQIKQDHTVTYLGKTQGKIVRLCNGFGFINSLEGLEYYFNETDLSNSSFHSLAAGDAVWFTPAGNIERPHAQKVSKCLE